MVALRFTDGGPAVLLRDPRERQAGGGDSQNVSTGERGRMAVWVSSLDATWCDLPFRPAFVTLLHDLMGWLNRPRLVADSVPPGQVWSPVIPGAAKTRGAVAGWGIRQPDGSRLDAALFVAAADADTAPVLKVDRTERPGVYRLVQGAGPSSATSTAIQTLAVNVDTRESSPTLWSESQIRDLFPQQRLDVVAGGGTLDPIPLTATQGSEIWPLLAAALGFLLLLETLLAYRFSYQKTVALPAGAQRHLSGMELLNSHKSEGVTP
jgi:hypothetical protein